MDASSPHLSDHLRLMLPDCASRQFHEFVPVPCFFLAAGPELFYVMKNGHSGVVVASLLIVFCGVVLLLAAFIDTLEFASRRDKYLLFQLLRSLFFFDFFLLLVEVADLLNLFVLLLLQGFLSIGHGA